MLGETLLQTENDPGHGKQHEQFTFGRIVSYSSILPARTSLSRRMHA